MFPFFNNYPGTDLHEIDLAYILKLCAELRTNNTTLMAWKATHEQEYAELADKVDGLINNLVDVIVPWDSSIAYHIFSIVEYQGTNYIAVQDVPIGAMITDTDYWQPAQTVIEQVNAIGATVSDLGDHVQKNIINMQEAGIVPNSGEDVTDAIQAIIDAAGENSIFYFPAGEYLIREVSVNSTYDDDMDMLMSKLLGIKLVNNGCTIYGDGSATIFKGIDPVGSIAGCIINISGTDCSVHDVQIYGNYGIHQTVTLPTQGNGKDEWLWGISVKYPARRLRIYNCHFQNCFADGLNIYNPGANGPSIVFVDKCTFDTCGRNAIQIGKGKYVFVSNCRMNNITGEQTTGCAIDVESHDAVTSDVFIANCSWSDTEQGCIFVAIENGILTNCSGSGNYCAVETIQINDSMHPLNNGVLIHGCTFNGVARIGAYTTIEGCIASNINAEPRNNVLTKCVIKNNTCSRIDCASTQYVSEDHVKIVNNTVAIISAYAAADGVDIIGNIINTDIFITTPLKNCIIKDNSIVTTDAYANSGAIHAENSNNENIVIENNTIDDSGPGSVSHQCIRVQANGLKITKNFTRITTNNVAVRARGSNILIAVNTILTPYTTAVSVIADDNKGYVINNTVISGQATPTNAISGANVSAGNEGATY